MLTYWENQNKPAATSQGHHVLVVDDEQSMRDSCCQVLTQSGYRVETAGDGISGLQKLRQTKPDLVLVDLRMPGLGGMEFLEKLETIDPHVVPVVITGHASLEGAVEAMRRNASDFLAKPFTPDQLRTVITRGLERRRRSLASRQRQREKEVLRENLIAIACHQLRSPLAAAQQYLSVVLEGFTGDVTELQQQTVAKASQYLDRLLQLITCWLDMSCLEAGHPAERLALQAVHALLKDCVEDLRPLAQAKGVTWEMDFCDGGFRIQGHKEGLKQALMNVLSNAVHYNKPGGRVTLSTSTNHDSLAIEISDTGIGISPEHIDFIFDLFFRAKTRETRAAGGSGLGLSIAQRIIEAHKGSIEVVSQPGEGTTFCIYLPMAGLD